MEFRSKYSTRSIEIFKRLMPLTAREPALGIKVTKKTRTVANELKNDDRVRFQFRRGDLFMQRIPFRGQCQFT